MYDNFSDYPLLGVNAYSNIFINTSSKIISSKFLRNESKYKSIVEIIGMNVLNFLKNELSDNVLTDSSEGGTLFIFKIKSAVLTTNIF